MNFGFWRRLAGSRKLHRELKAYAIALVSDVDTADDLVQDTLLKIHDAPSLPSRPELARRYAFRMLRNLHIDNLRKTKVRMEYCAEQERLYMQTARSAFDPIDEMMVRDAFSRLSPDHREILFLIDVMGFQYAEAAETLDVATGTIMSRVSRARKEMMELMDASPLRSLEKRRRQGR